MPNKNVYNIVTNSRRQNLPAVMKLIRRNSEKSTYETLRRTKCFDYGSNFPLWYNQSIAFLIIYKHFLKETINGGQ